jgi:hypothetical protein
MAIRSSLRCEIRAVVLHLWPDEIKVYPHVRVTIPVGRRGQKLRYVLLAQSRKLQGYPWRHGGSLAICAYLPGKGGNDGGG